MEGEGCSLEIEVENQDKPAKLSRHLVMAEKPEVSPLEEAESLPVNGKEGSLQNQDSTNPENPQHLEPPLEENFQQKFRNFRYKDASGPRQLLQHLRQLSRRWLDPEVYTKEQMIEMLVQEQLQAITHDGITGKNPPMETPPEPAHSADARKHVPWN